MTKRVKIAPDTNHHFLEEVDNETLFLRSPEEAATAIVEHRKERLRA